MTLYLDTSSLVKLYVEELDSQEIRRLAADADVIVTSVVAYAEARSAFARQRRERRLAPQASRIAIASFERDWPGYVSIVVTGTLAQSAGALADRFGLCGFDAIHLASFEHVIGHAEGEDLRFSSADKRLVKAAKRLG